MPGFPVPFIKFREDDANGFPLAAGKLYSYAAGTSTPLATYSTHVVPPDVLAVPNANPTVLDASGRASIYIPDGVGYKFILKDALDNTIWTEDNVEVPEIEPPPTPSEVPTGGIVMYGALPTVGGAPGGTTVPYVWLHCNGAAVSRFDYSVLFGIIGESFGPGNGSTTFNVPDLRQRVPLGVAASGTGNVLGSTGGAIDHTHSGPTHTHAVAAHTHSMAAHTHVVPYNGWGYIINTPPLTGVIQVGGSGVGSEASVMQATGSIPSGPSTVTDTGANTVGIVTDPGGTAATGSNNPPFVAVHFIIKT